MKLLERFLDWLLVDAWFWLPWWDFTGWIHRQASVIRRRTRVVRAWDWVRWRILDKWVIMYGLETLITGAFAVSQVWIHAWGLAVIWSLLASGFAFLLCIAYRDARERHRAASRTMQMLTYGAPARGAVRISSGRKVGKSIFSPNTPMTNAIVQQQAAAYFFAASAGVPPMTGAQMAYMQEKAMEEQAKRLLVKMAKDFNQTYRELVAAITSFELSSLQAAQAVISAASVIGLRDEPPELEAPTGVDVAGYVYGVRSWKPLSRPTAVPKLTALPVEWMEERLNVPMDWILGPLNGGEAWEPGENVATCKHQQGTGTVFDHEPHAVGYPGCGCGYWAFWTVEALDEYHSVGSHEVSGIIRGWGNVLEASLGFRAEKAEIIGLLLSPDWEEVKQPDAEIATTYKVPIYRYGEGMKSKYWDESVYTVDPRINPLHMVYCPGGVEPVPLPHPSEWRPA